MISSNHYTSKECQPKRAAGSCASLLFCHFLQHSKKMKNVRVGGGGSMSLYPTLAYTWKYVDQKGWATKLTSTQSAGVEPMKRASEGSSLDLKSRADIT